MSSKEITFFATKTQITAKQGLAKENKFNTVLCKCKGGSYMSPFWNHILAKKGRFIHVRSQILWYVCSMYLGTKGDFFSYTCTFCALLPRCCALLCFPTYVPYVQFLILRILRTACVLLLTICRHTIFPRESEKKSFGSTYAKKIEAKKTSRSTIHVICQR
jgi:hypothetical protein